MDEDMRTSFLDVPCGQDDRLSSSTNDNEKTTLERCCTSNSGIWGIQADRTAQVALRLVGLVFMLAQCIDASELMTCSKDELLLCISCEDYKCAAKRDCFEEGHKFTCYCQFGFVEPAKGSNQKAGCVKADMVTQKIYGDPHFATLDRSFYDYQGSCPYTFLKPCKTLGMFHDFELSIKNKVYLNWHPFYTFVDEIQFVFMKQTVFIDTHRSVFFNGRRIATPFYFPANDDKTLIWVYKTGKTITVYARNSVSFSIRDHLFTYRVPRSPLYEGDDALCGLGGNLNGRCDDDIRSRNGSIYKTSSCVYSKNKSTVLDISKFLDTWIVHDFASGSQGCHSGEWMAERMDLNCENVPAAEAACRVIADARESKGMFASCAPLFGEENLFESCVIDLCISKEGKCSTLTEFAERCLADVKGANISNWRTEAGCPMSCPEKSSYSSCVTACQPACGNTSSSFCDTTCHEGCECMSGYLMDYAAVEPKCVLPSQCPCQDAEGNSLEPRISYMGTDCTSISVCVNGKIRSRRYKCPEHSTCGLVDGIRSCVCLPGYNWDDSEDYCAPV